MSKAAIFIINFYQVFLSFDRGVLRLLIVGGACRYKISCSEYLKQVIIKYGFLKGVAKGGKRLLACQPFNSL